MSEPAPKAYSAAASPSAGFAMIPRAVLDLKDIDLIGMYAVLAGFANEKRECWPKLDTIVSASGKSRPYVVKQIARLETAGVLVHERRTVNGMKSVSKYRLLAEVRKSTTFTTQSTTFTEEVNDVDHRGKPRLLQELEPVELEPVELDPPLPPEGNGGAYSEEFEREFWARYPKGRGSKADAYKLWRKMSAADRRAAIASLPLFAAGSDWLRGFHKGPEVWLRGRCWENPPGGQLNGNGVAVVDVSTPEAMKRYMAEREASARKALI